MAQELTMPKLSDSMAAYFRKCKEKLGFVPNVLKAYAFDMAKLEAFVAMYNDLMLGPSGLSKTEREMIEHALAKSGNNKSQAARLLGLTRAQLRARLEKYGLGTTD